MRGVGGTHSMGSTRHLRSCGFTLILALNVFSLKPADEGGKKRKRIKEWWSHMAAFNELFLEVAHITSVLIQLAKTPLYRLPRECSAALCPGRWKQSCWWTCTHISISGAIKPTRQTHFLQLCLPLTVYFSLLVHMLRSVFRGFASYINS